MVTTGKAASGNPQWTLVATILASSLAFIDGSVVNVALPAIGRSYHAVRRPAQNDLLIGNDLDDVNGKAAGESGEVPSDRRAALHPPFGTARGEIVRQPGGIGDGFQHLMHRLGDVAKDLEAKIHWPFSLATTAGSAQAVGVLGALKRDLEG